MGLDDVAVASLRFLPAVHHHMALHVAFYAPIGVSSTSVCLTAPPESGRADQHDYQLFLAINDIGHTKTKVKSPRTNGICERFHKTILREFYQVTFRKKFYETIEQLRNDLVSAEESSSTASA